jgi:hypothetical protein
LKPLLVACAVLACAGSLSALTAEEVLLRSGETISGRVTGQDSTVVFLSTAHGTKNIAKLDILRIQYAPFTPAQKAQALEVRRQKEAAQVLEWERIRRLQEGEERKKREEQLAAKIRAEKEAAAQAAADRAGCSTRTGGKRQDGEAPWTNPSHTGTLPGVRWFCLVGATSIWAVPGLEQFTPWAPRPSSLAYMKRTDEDVPRNGKIIERHRPISSSQPTPDYPAGKQGPCTHFMRTQKRSPYTGTKCTVTMARWLRWAPSTPCSSFTSHTMALHGRTDF